MDSAMATKREIIEVHKKRRRATKGENQNCERAGHNDKAYKRLTEDLLCNLTNTGLTNLPHVR